VRRFLTGKTAWCVHEHVRSGLLIDVQDYYRAFYVAASRARRSILLLGWQFDSDVRLLRGDDVPPGRDPKDYELLTLLDRLSRERPELEVKMLAWDHSVFFTFEREVLQKIVFDLSTVDRLQFRTDGTVPLGGSHHQKVAIIDGQVAFMGSADICQDRWDTSAHVAHDPRRVSRNDLPNKPYHEVQAVFGDEAARVFVDLFVERWHFATGTRLDRDELIAPESADLFASIPVTLPMPLAPVGFSRTVPAADERSHVHEIRDLYVRAIHRAEQMIYIETQYFTSQCVRDALVARMNDVSRSRLDVVLVLPQKPENLKEELTIAAPQADVLTDVVAAARENGHALGVYDVAVPDPDGTTPDAFVYIHAKLMIVDDVFFTMGSANLANRSMTVDSEINATWVAEPGDHVVHAAIRRARVRLLLEHLGDAPRGVRVVAARRGLVARLDRVAREGKGRLRHHDLHRELQGAIAKAVSDLANDYVDPTDGIEPLPPPSASSAW